MRYVALTFGRFYRQRELNNDFKESVTLEEIDNVDNLVDKLERIELPNQLISAFHGPLLRKYLDLNPSEIASSRIEMWLSAVLADELESARIRSTTSEGPARIFRSILLYARYHNVRIARIRPVIAWLTLFSLCQQWLNHS